MASRQSPTSIESQILELLDAHFEGNENPHITIVKISALLRDKDLADPQPESERLH